MAASSNLSAWQKRGLRMLNNLIEDREFLSDIERLRTSADLVDLDTVNIFSVLEKHSVPLFLFACVEEFITSGEIRPELIRSSVSLVTDIDEAVLPSMASSNAHVAWDYHRQSARPEVKLVLDASTTQTELVDFIRRHWSEIEGQIKKIDGPRPSRVREKPKRSRDKQVMDLSAQGWSNARIARHLNAENEGNDEEIALTTEDVRLIISRHKSTKRSSKI